MSSPRNLASVEPQPRSRSRMGNRESALEPYSANGARPNGNYKSPSVEDEHDAEAGDIEAQTPKEHYEQWTRLPLSPRKQGKGFEYEVEPTKKYVYLGGWFIANLALTLHNKVVMQNFRFPWLMTSLHATCAALGCYGLTVQRHTQLQAILRRDLPTMFALSLLFTLNIAISNVSLAAVSVPFHQVMRALCPICTIILYRLFFARTYSQRTWLSIIPVVCGVALATYGDYYCTVSGFVLTLLGVVLSATKTVVLNRLMTGSLQLPALDLLLRMSPLAALQSLLISQATGEWAEFRAFAATGGLSGQMLLALLMNGLIAAALNVLSFETNRLAGALTMTVAGNLKQCLTVLLGVVLFQVHVGPLNGLGMLVTILGAAWYSFEELHAKAKRKERPR